MNYFLSNSSKPDESTTSEKTSSEPRAKDSSKTVSDSKDKSADTKEPSKDKNSLSKDDWLNKLKLAAPQLICKEFLKDNSLSKQLGKLNIDYDKCLSLIPNSIDKCKSELYANIPESMSKDDSEKWGNAIGECIGKDFAIKYLLPSSAKPKS